LFNKKCKKDTKQESYQLTSYPHELLPLIVEISVSYDGDVRF